MASHPPLLSPLVPLRLGRHRGWCVGVCVRVCAYLCVQLLCDCFPEPEPSLAQREMADCGNDRAVLQCTGLNVKLIFNVWHFTQIIRPQTWPWGIPQIAFSVPQQLWNYSSQREREREGERGRGREGGKPLSLAKWSPSHCSGHPRLEARSLSPLPFFSVISWSQGCAKLKTSWQSGGCMK